VLTTCPELLPGGALAGSRTRDLSIRHTNHYTKPPCLGPSSYLRIGGRRLIFMCSCLLYIEHVCQRVNIPVHCLMSSVQRLCGIPRRLFPAMMPCRTCMHRLSACTTWPKYCSFLLLTSARKRHVNFSSLNIDLLVLCSVQWIHIILMYMSISNVFSLLLSAALIVHNSDQYVAIYQTKVCISLHFNCKFKEWSFHRLVSDLAADLAIPRLAVMTALRTYLSQCCYVLLCVFVIYP